MRVREEKSRRPHATYKGSNSDWTGKIPEHWKTTTIKRVIHTQSGGTPPTEKEEYYGGNIPWVTSSELREQTINSTAKTVSKKATSEVSSLKLHPEGSVVIAMYGATIGRLN